MFSSPGKGIDSREGWWLALGGLAFYAVLTIGFITTSHATRTAVLIVRWSAIVIVLSICIALVASRALSRRAVLALAAYIGFLVLAVSLSVVYGGFTVLPIDIAIQAMVTAVGVILWIGSDDRFWTWRLPQFVVWYSVLCVGILVMAGGFAPDLPPRYVFDFIEDRNDEAVGYSQEISKLFGIAAIAVVSIMAGWRTTLKLVFGVLIVLAFLMLSFLGGARGDSVAALLVVAAAIFARSPLLGVSLFVAISAAIFYAAPGSLQDIMIVQRLLWTIDGDMGERDQLLLQSLQLLADNPHCAIAGCGAGFFQFSYGFPYQRYPHNVIAEAFITFGLPLALIYFAVLAVGVRSFARQKGWLSFPVLLFGYFFIISMKSSDLFMNPFLTLLSLFFISRWVFGAGVMAGDRGGLTSVFSARGR